MMSSSFMTTKKSSVDSEKSFVFENMSKCSSRYMSRKESMTEEEEEECLIIDGFVYLPQMDGSATRQSLVLKDAKLSFGVTSHLLTIESSSNQPFLARTPKTIHLVNKITNVLQITF